MKKIAFCLSLVISMTLIGISLSTSKVKAQSNCTHYADSSATTDGSGNLTSPWKFVDDHEHQLVAGNILCLRGTISGNPREYRESTLNLTQNGTASNPITIKAYPEELVKIRVADGDSGVLNITGDYWTFQDLILDNNNQMQPVVSIPEAASHVSLIHNEITDSRYNGVGVWGDNVTLENNHIHHIDYETAEQDAECVTVHRTADNFTARGNEIHDCEGNAIEFYEVCETADPTIQSENFLIENNIVYRGSITWAESGIGFKQGGPGMVRNNELYGYDGNSGQHRALGVRCLAHDITFESNWVHDLGTQHGVPGFPFDWATGGPFHPENITVKNNIFEATPGSAATGHMMWIQDGYNLVIVNNTFYCDSSYYYGIYVRAWQSGVFKNNIIYNCRDNYELYTDAFKATTGNNAWINTNPGFMSGPGDVTAGNLDFLNTSTRPYNLHIGANSVARNRGANLGVTTDFDGQSRDATPDIGADEYLTATPSPDPQDCTTATSTWQRHTFTPQTGMFAYSFDAFPSTTFMDAGLGFSASPAATFAETATYTRFNSSGFIDTRHGGAYAAMNQIPYTPDTRYHFRLVVNVPSKTYSAYVTPEGGQEQIIGQNYDFRTTPQADVTSLSYANFIVSSGGMTVCNLGLTPPITRDLVLAWLSNFFDQNGDNKVNIFDFAALLP